MTSDLSQLVNALGPESLGEGATADSCTLAVIYGPPCAGKTTISRAMERQLGYHRVSMDIVRRVLAHDDPKFFDLDYQETVFKAMCCYIEECLKSRRSVTCEALVIAEWRYELLTTIASRHSAVFRGFYLHAPLKVLGMRLRERKRRGCNSEGFGPEELSLNRLARFHRMAKRHSVEDVEVNTGKLDALGTLRVVGRLLRGEA